MTDRHVLIQSVTIQRTEVPKGFRVWSDGAVEHTAPDNALPGPTERLDRDRDLIWQSAGQLTADQVEQLSTAIVESGIFDLPPSLLINYCKDDPGVAIWTVNIDGRVARILVYDPRPRRSAELDKLSAFIAAITA
jgi:hypothetical protein